MVKRMSPKSASPAVEPATRRRARTSLRDEVQSVIATLRNLATKHTLDGMSRYRIPSDNALGVSVGDIRNLAKRLGKNHDLAAALWENDIYEARMLACFVDEAARVTPAQMDRWCRDFDSWAICDTACFHLFDRTPHAFRKVEQWSRRRAEFVKRAAFALLASLALHDKKAADEMFVRYLPLIEKAADDKRNFVKKGVSWALRAIGTRRRELHGIAVAVAQRLATSDHAAARWVGKDALRELTKPATTRRLARSRKGEEASGRV